MNTQEAYKSIQKMYCSKCNGKLELVWNGTAKWRVSCMKNDMLEDDVEPPCKFEDVYGVSPEDAVIKAQAQL